MDAIPPSGPLTPLPPKRPDAVPTPDPGGQDLSAAPGAQGPDALPHDEAELSIGDPYGDGDEPASASGTRPSNSGPSAPDRGRG